MEQPPDDPEMWSHEQWIAWLNSTQPDGDADQAARRGPRSRGMGATVLGAGMLGLQQAIFGPIDEPDIVVVADADGHDDEDLKLDFVPDQPQATSVELRGHWLRRWRRRPDSTAPHRPGPAVP
ncbi:MAG: hypothetical protein ACLGHT_03135 [Acidimicrobiia bacterium]